jgi:Domain of unknown function (DUF4160)
MASRCFGGVRFCVYSNDHSPRHVHAFVAETVVIIDLLKTGEVQLAKRKQAIRPGNAKKTDVRKALSMAAQYFEELALLWEGTHGKA